MQQLGSHHWASIGRNTQVAERVTAHPLYEGLLTYEQGVEVPLLDESADDRTVQECEDRQAPEHDGDDQERHAEWFGIWLGALG